MRAATVALVVAAACGGDNRRITRSDGGAPAVQVVDRGSAATPVTPAVGEREPNDDAATALPLTAAGARGVLDGSSDRDAYAIDVAALGMLEVRVTAVPGVDLALELRDATFAVVRTSDHGGAGVAEGLPNAPVDRGRYFAVVREVERKARKGRDAAGRQGASAPYEITARPVVADVASGEFEPNDDGADELTLANPGVGYLGWKGDVDRWKLAVDGLGAGDALDVSVGAVAGSTITVELTDAAGRRLARQTGAAKGAEVALLGIVPRVVAGEPAIVYAVITGTPANPEVAYRVVATARMLAPAATDDPMPPEER